MPKKLCMIVIKSHKVSHFQRSLIILHVKIILKVQGMYNVAVIFVIIIVVVVVIITVINSLSLLLILYYYYFYYY